MADVNQAANKEWTLTTLNGKKVDIEKPPTMKFSNGKLVRLRRHQPPERILCVGRRQRDHGQIVSTKMAGPPELMELESEFAKALASVDGFHVHGNELALSSKGSVVANFRSKP